MAIRTVWIIEGCISCCSCEEHCPEVFLVEGTSRVLDGVDPNDFDDHVRLAAEVCPVEVIKIAETETEAVLGKQIG